MIKQSKCFLSLVNSKIYCCNESFFISFFQKPTDMQIIQNMSQKASSSNANVWWKVSCLKTNTQEKHKIKGHFNFIWMVNWKRNLLGPNTVNITSTSKVGIKGSWFVNHKSISWSHEPKIHKISIFHKLFFQNIILNNEYRQYLSVYLLKWMNYIKWTRLIYEKQKSHWMFWIFLNYVIIH